MSSGSGESAAEYGIIHGVNKNLKQTIQAWPVIAAATIGLCFLTQSVAKLFGIDLPDQQNVDTVRQWMLHAFDSPRNFATCAFLLVQVLLLLPMLEEVYFRYFLYRRSQRPICRMGLAHALLPSLARLSICFYVQHGSFGPVVQRSIAEKFHTNDPWGMFWQSVAVFTVVEYLLRTLAMRMAVKLLPCLAVLLSSALFSAAHYIAQPFPDSAFIALFFFGLAQCWLYSKTDHIWCPMLNHALFNLTNIVLLLVLPR